MLERVGRGREEEGGCVMMMMIAAVTTLGVIVQTLPKFLSCYVADIVNKVQKHTNRTLQCLKERKKKEEKELILHTHYCNCMHTCTMGQYRHVLTGKKSHSIST